MSIGLDTFANFVQLQVNLKNAQEIFTNVGEISSLLLTKGFEQGH